MKTKFLLQMCFLVALVGCDDSGDEPESETPSEVGASPTTDPVPADEESTADPGSDPRDEIRGRFCEIFIGYPAESGVSGNVDFEIWGSQSLGNCPQAEWEALDFDAIQEEFGALVVLPNGPRAILTDFGEGVALGENVRSFGGIDMQVVSYLTDFDPSTGGEDTPYTSNIVDQDGAKGFSAGREVYEIVTDEGEVYSLVTVDLNVVPSLEDLPALGARLENLPDGWVWQATVLENERRIEANGTLLALRDEFGNTYQRAADPEPSADPRDEIRGRFCEIFIGYPAESGVPGNVDFEIWGSQSLGNCPQAEWEALDFDAIQEEFGALVVLPNGPRAILTDFGEGVALGENVRSFGGIDMQIVSYLNDFDPSTGGEDNPYTSNIVDQDGAKGFSAGREVYEIVTDEGEVYSLVTVDLNVVPSLEDLPALGARLENLPDGWVWQATVLETERRIEANGTLLALRDEFGNTYQRAAD